MANNGTEGGMITRNEARQLMMNYRNSPAFAANGGQEGILFGKDHIIQLLQQSGCMGVRVYYGKDSTTGPAQLIIVGTDSDGNDMPNLILDMGIPCPTHCSSAATKV